MTFVSESKYGLISKSKPELKRMRSLDFLDQSLNVNLALIRLA